jgi:tetratricopeptide (TPR) repeat protein
MKKLALAVALWLAILPPRAAQAAGAKPMPLLSGMGNLHHPIATKSPEAQKFFDQGMTLMYGFNHAAAIASFRKAAELDPDAVMPLWGIAIALGPNINMDVDADGEKQAYAAAQAALAKSAGAPAEERAFVEAVAKRYSDDPKADRKALSKSYADAMKALVARYPDDLDASTLYAESLMDLHPWDFWQDGKPRPWTPEIMGVLESVLRRNPDHVGANHFYIHTVEASPHPEWALPCARRLQTLVPAVGHLVHMPGHVFIRTGDYDGAVQANVRAALADRAFFAATGETGLYPLMYYNHNLQFGSAAAVIEGNFKAAIEPAEEMAKNLAAVVRDMPMAEPLIPAAALVRVEFHRWKEIFAEPMPAADFKVATAFALYTRAAALAGQGKAAEAAKAREAFEKARAAVPADFPQFGTNSPASILAVASADLEGRIASSRRDSAAAIVAYRKSVAAQDALNYDEPPPWIHFERQPLGAALLEAGRAEEAEKVFREDLDRNPRNGRSLFGLWKSLEAQRKPVDADWVRRAYEKAWKNADSPLTLSDL